MIGFGFTNGEVWIVTDWEDAEGATLVGDEVLPVKQLGLLREPPEFTPEDPDA